MSRSSKVTIKCDDKVCHRVREDLETNQVHSDDFPVGQLASELEKEAATLIRSVEEDKVDTGQAKPALNL